MSHTQDNIIKVGDTVYFTGNPKNELHEKPAKVLETGIIFMDVNKTNGGTTRFLSVQFEGSTQSRLIAERRFEKQLTNVSQTGRYHLSAKIA